MTVSVKLTKQGNSTGVRLPKDVLEAAGFQRGDEVTLDVANGRVTLTKAGAPYNAAMSAYEECRTRYAKTLHDLSK
ncbi:AbrB/MazE/SpoVT family DNA-binding domain-containing protein [Oceanicaulis alexandrii]|uniref:AbrB/MazE/SpoVT family DNA-binding domain-containing protein n=1 Tax=Oceanicaulis TaxID=153232 RepID=UPI0035CF4C20|tara:strand:+ start:478 stop:705 length:228 start_codon:yes stop_codon:yes gene_type:complete